MYKKTHCKIQKIPDSDLQMLTSKSWLINSQSRKGKSYTIKIMIDVRSIYATINIHVETYVAICIIVIAPIKT